MSSERRAVVTGGTSGIGAAVARRLAKDGAVVAFCSRDPEAVEAMERELAEISPGSFGVSADLADASQSALFIGEIEERFGGADLLINNVGNSTYRKFEQMSDDDWLQSMELSLMSAVRCTRALLPGMRERRYGRIVMISSIAARYPLGSRVDYGVFKAGMLVLAKALARQYGRHNVLVNSILPGMVHTSMWEKTAQEIVDIKGGTPSDAMSAIAKTVPVGRFGTAEEIAAAVAFLVSDDAGYVNGAAFDIDGGLGENAY